ncbi:hypothetical protein D3C72_2460350 [compost metagenome]
MDEHVHGFAGQRIEFDDRALCQLQDVLDRHLGAPQLHGQLHGNVQHHVDVVDRAVTVPGR